MHLLDFSHMKTLMRQGAVALLLTSLTLLHASAQDSISRKVVVQTPATYPTLARSMNIRGTVKLQAQVAPNGSVKKIDVLGGHPLLTQSAVTAVGHWRFEAASKETKEVIEIKFDPQ